jgi:hypothetical protein
MKGNRIPQAVPHARSQGTVSILDVDLDFFNLVQNPVRGLVTLLTWAGRPVDFIVHKHHEVLPLWASSIGMDCPTHILHVDEHHDMMDENKTVNIANFLYHAMRSWPKCRVHWLVVEPIDSPRMWLSETGWRAVSRRFSVGREIPSGWPKPELVSVCTSPDFVEENLRRRLIQIATDMEKRRKPLSSFHFPSLSTRQGSGSGPTSSWGSP